MNLLERIEVLEQKIDGHTKSIQQVLGMLVMQEKDILRLKDEAGVVDGVKPRPDILKTLSKLYRRWALGWDVDPEVKPMT